LEAYNAVDIALVFAPLVTVEIILVVYDGGPNGTFTTATVELKVAICQEVYRYLLKADNFNLNTPIIR